MTLLIIYLLISISTSQLWNNSKICGYIRRKIVLKIPYVRDALLCPTCSPFWVGIFISLFFNPLNTILPIGISNISESIINYAICGILYKNNILTPD